MQRMSAVRVVQYSVAMWLVPTRAWLMPPSSSILSSHDRHCWLSSSQSLPTTLSASSKARGWNYRDVGCGMRNELSSSPWHTTGGSDGGRLPNEFDAEAPWTVPDSAHEALRSTGWAVVRGWVPGEIAEALRHDGKAAKFVLLITLIGIGSVKCRRHSACACSPK